MLTLHMKKHYASVEDARASAAEFLFIWELDAALNLGREAIKFIFEDAELIDRIPPPPGTLEINVGSASMVAFGGVVTMRVTRSAYPEPPTGMKFCPDLETLWMRYEGYRAQREPLSAMAYFCLTVLDTSAGDRATAARQYNIKLDVLRKIGDLTTNRGDAATARKMRVKLLPYTPKEIGWLEAAIVIIIRRMAAVAAGVVGPMITMKDLPDL
jgi:hypothetical protein